MKKQLFLAFGAAALLASCSNDIDSPTAENIYDGYLHVKGTINEVKTRATENSFEANDQIGITGGTFTNVAYKYESNSFVAVDDQITVTEDNVTFSAYYPYATTLTGTGSDEIAFNLAEEGNFDFLFATGDASRETPQVTFNFNHKMSQVAFKVIDSTEENDLDGLKGQITLKNVATTGSFNTKTGDITADEASKSLSISEVEAATTADGATEYTVILPSYSTAPQDGINVVLAINEKTYSGKITPDLAAGTKYSYTLTIDDSSTDPTLTISTADITGWTSETSKDIAMVEDYSLQVGDYLLSDGTTKAPNDKDFENFKSDIVGVVYFVGDPHPSVLYPSLVQSGQDILMTDYPGCVNGLAVAINNYSDTPVKFVDNKFNFDSWLKANEDKAAIYFKGTGFNAGNVLPNQFLGYNYTAMILDAQTNGKGNYTPEGTDPETVGADAIANMLEEVNTTKIKGASTWFITSYGEFAEIADNYTTVQKSVIKAEGNLEKFSNEGKPASDNFYWTSDYRNATNQYVSVLDELEAANAIETKNGGSVKGFFRLSIAF